MPIRVKEGHGRTTTPSDLLSELHVYIVPIDKWIPFRRLARNQVVEETVSAGFVRVLPATTLLELRNILQQQLEFDVPSHYVFIKSVGRNFTQVKTHQEETLKVKNFLPPHASDPEIHILEISQDLLKKSGSIPNLILSDTELSDSAGLGTSRTSRMSYNEQLFNSTFSPLEESILPLQNSSAVPTAEDAEDTGDHPRLNETYLILKNSQNEITLDYKVGERKTNGKVEYSDSCSDRPKLNNFERSDKQTAQGSSDEDEAKPRDDSRKRVTRRNIQPIKTSNKSVPLKDQSRPKQKSTGPKTSVPHKSSLVDQSHRSRITDDQDLLGNKTRSRKVTRSDHKELIARKTVANLIPTENESEGKNARRSHSEDRSRLAKEGNLRESHERARESMNNERARKYEDALKKEEDERMKRVTEEDPSSSKTPPDQLLNLDCAMPVKEVVFKKSYVAKSSGKIWEEKREETDQDGRDPRKEAWEEVDAERTSAESRRTMDMSHTNSRTSRSSNAVQGGNLESQLQDIQNQKSEFEEKRNVLFLRARCLHEEIISLRDKRRQKWWTVYDSAKREGRFLEERQNSLRSELDVLYRKVIGSLLKREPLVTGVKGGPSKKANYKINVIRLRHEIADLTRRVEAIDIKVQAETKLRYQAEQELKTLRAEVGRKKASVALTRARNPSLRSITYIPEDILIRL